MPLPGQSRFTSKECKYMFTKNFSMRKLATIAVISGLTAAASVVQAQDTAGLDVLAVARQKGNFTVLTRAIEAAGLQQTLSAQGPMTVFAPTDEAFAKLPAGELDALLKPENKDKLVKILSFHVLPGKALDQDQMKRTRSAVTAEGDSVEFALVRGRLRVSDARVTSDYAASNGVVHAVDRVLMPK